MAYFANGIEGMCFDDECLGCVLGEQPCPIAFVQQAYNYDAVDNKVATDILNSLVDNGGTCHMKNMFPEHFKIDAKQEELPL